jgi:hypothetical protein
MMVGVSSQSPRHARPEGSRPAHPQLVPFDVDGASADPRTAVERLALLNAIIAASNATRSLAELLPRLLDAVCERYPGLCGALARFADGRVAIESTNPAGPGPVDWPALFAALPEASRTGADGAVPLVLDDRPGGAIVVPLAPVNGVTRALAFADHANTIGFPTDVMAAIALECS